MADIQDLQNLPDFGPIVEQLSSISSNLSKMTDYLSSAGSSIQDNTKKYNKFKKSVKESLENDLKYKAVMEEISKQLKIQEQYKRREQKISEQNLKIQENLKKIMDLDKTLSKQKRKSQDAVDELKRLKDLQKQYLTNIRLEEEELKKQQSSFDASEEQLEILSKKQKDIEKRAESKAKVIEFATNAAQAGLGALYSLGRKVLDTALETESTTAKLAANYGLSYKETTKLKNNLAKASVYTAMIGVKTEDLVKMQAKYSDETGRAVVLSKDNLVTLGEMAVATGMGVDEAAGFTSNMDLFGLSIKSSSLMINDLINNAKKQGVSASVATKKVNDNLKLANSYIFKGGVKGMMDMTAYAIKMRINMDEVAKLADKVSSPEGALETAAALQSLGGAYSALSDPIQLLNESLNDMEGLTKRYEGMTASMMRFSKETGEVKFTGGSLDMMRAKEAAKAMGVSYDEMIKVARTKAKREAIVQDVKFNTNINAEDKELIASMSEFNKTTGKWEVSVYNKEKDEYTANEINKLSKSQIASLRPTEVQIKDVARNTQGIHDMIKNFFDFMKKSFAYPVVKILNQLHPALTRIANLFGGDIESLALGEQSGGILGTGDIAKKESSTFSKVGAVGSSINAIHKGANLLKGSEAIFENTKLYSKVAEKAGASFLGKESGEFLAKTLFKKLPLIGAAISLMSAIGRLSKGDFAGAGIDVLSGAVSFVPYVGTAVGMGLDIYNAKRDVDKLSSPSDNINDGIVKSNGQVVKINKQDDVLAMKKGGPVESLLGNNKNNGRLNKYGNVDKNIILNAYNKLNSVNGTIASSEKTLTPEALKLVSIQKQNIVNQKKIESSKKEQKQIPLTGSIEHVIKGEIKISGGNTSTKLDVNELLKNPEFVKELTAIIANQFNRDNNGGVYSGNLNKYAMR